MSVAIRPATSADASAVLDLLAQGFETYRAFAPPDWRPPAPSEETGIALGAMLAHPDVWFVVAEDDRGHAGQCGFMPATTRRNMQGDRVTGTGHLWQLFVREDRWGSGLADDLHARALGAMRERGYTRARLHTPAGQSRARRFYERHGWFEAPISLDDPAELGLPLVEYRLGIK